MQFHPESIASEHGHALLKNFLELAGALLTWPISNPSSPRRRAASRSPARKRATAFDVLMSGEATPSQIGGFLMALRVRGETVDEITGAVEIMREKMLKVEAPSDAIDIVGTGGDASGSYNISTCAAFVAAGAGLKIAKHGNRALVVEIGSGRCA